MQYLYELEIRFFSINLGLQKSTQFWVPGFKSQIKWKFEFFSKKKLKLIRGILAKFINKEHFLWFNYSKYIFVYYYI